jgi:hypothetical protein
MHPNVSNRNDDCVSRRFPWNNMTHDASFVAEVGYIRDNLQWLDTNLDFPIRRDSITSGVNSTSNGRAALSSAMSSDVFSGLSSIIVLVGSLTLDAILITSVAFAAVPRLGRPITPSRRWPELPHPHHSRKVVVGVTVTVYLTPYQRPSEGRWDTSNALDPS